MKEILSASEQGYGLWFVWVAAAILVIIGYIRVRRSIKRLEKSDDLADVGTRTPNPNEIEPSARKHNGAG
jgi:hypothetical protein